VLTKKYGTVRVYEWGPEDGRKVLLVHGISTPCLCLGAIAEGLVMKGCRVMLFDLWGRGYSDSVDLPHDSRLYSTEILLAITSSPLAWTPEGFSLIGYSLGGGISVDFTASFPDMVKALVLLAPTGLIRPSHFQWHTRLMYNFVPEVVVQRIVRRRLAGSGGAVHPHQKTASVTPLSAVSEEIKGARDSVFESAVLSKNRPGITVANAVQWQFQNHDGFIQSFVSSVKYSSISGKNETWKKLGLRNDKVLIIAGSSDHLM
jgi:pimeloyl-ACP methyl ester carboxylesterase